MENNPNEAPREAQLAVANQLLAEAQTPEDKAFAESQVQEYSTPSVEPGVLGSEQPAASAELGKDAVKLVMLGDGSVALTSEVEASQAAGHEASHAYGNGRRA